jgi:hypothetical protein
MAIVITPYPFSDIVLIPIPVSESNLDRIDRICMIVMTRMFSLYFVHIC